MWVWDYSQRWDFPAKAGTYKEWKPNACSITALQYNISRRLFWVSNGLPCSSVLLSAGQSLTEGEIPSFNSFWEMWLAKRLDELGQDPAKEPVPRYSDVEIFRLSQVLQITLISES